MSESPVVPRRFRKKPVVIEAFQMTRQRRATNEDWPEWLHIAWNEPREAAGALFPADYPNSDGTDQLKIMTLEGEHLVGWGDWIIRGVKGELYPCKPDIFAMTYEAEGAQGDTLQADVVRLRAYPWADPRLGQAYELLMAVRAEWTNESGVHDGLTIAIREVENCDLEIGSLK